MSQIAAQSTEKENNVEEKMEKFSLKVSLINPEIIVKL